MIQRLFLTLVFLLLLPVYSALGAAILIFSGWPIFFIQDRVGQKGRVFKIIKFRTMVPDAEKKKKAVGVDE